MLYKKLFLAGAFILSIALAVKAQKTIDYVNPFIGTAAHGHTYPGATVPFGMIQLSPDNGTEGWDWCSGYNYSDSVIEGFSHLHLSGTGIGDLCDISVLPLTGVATAEKIRLPFSHDKEKASPGYYAVLLGNNVLAELTTTERVGYHRYTFPKSENAQIRFNLGFAINGDRPTECYFKKINDTTFIGYRFSKGWAPVQHVYFAVRTSKPVKSLVLFDHDKQIVNNTEVKDVATTASLMFSTREQENIQMKVALSSANIEGALAGLEKEKEYAFNTARKYAESQWEMALGRIKARSTNKDYLQTFYTALYHAFEAPVIFNDALGNYRGVDGKIAHTNQDIYTVSSLWDVFRGESPLLTIVQPERVPDIINSYLRFYQQHGLLPVWDLEANETNCMPGYHCVPIITDAILKGFKGFDVSLAYEAMIKSAMQDIRGTNFYRQYGYIPMDKYGQSASFTLEYAYDDWCIAQVAKKLGKQNDYETFMKRAASWKNLFDPSVGFMRGKNADGSWYTPFNPYYSEHADKAMFTEGNAWQHSWFVPQDIYGLINAHGGVKPFVTKLDSLFTVSSQLAGTNTSPDISGMIGQYAHGNEPSHHIAYLYNFAGMPWKTAEKVNQICTTLYTNKTDGLCGNEDCGQMSAWYVWSAMGLYPANASSGRYVIGTPLLSESKINVGNGKTFIIEAQNLTEKNIYVQKVTLNGKPYTKSYIDHKDVIDGSKLILYMGSKPSLIWGVVEKDRP